MEENKPVVRSWGQALRLILCGMCMGTADLVPGVSGGTMAFITGIYEDLLRGIRSINASFARDLLSLRWKQAFQRIPFGFLSSVFLGLGLAVVLFSKGIWFLLNHEFYRSILFSSFLGLILASVMFCQKRVRRWSVREFVFLSLGVVVAWGLTSLPSLVDTEDQVFDVQLTLSELDVQRIANYNAATGMLREVAQDDLSAMLAKGIVEASTPVYSYQRQIFGTVGQFVEAKHYPFFDPWLFFCGCVGISAMLLPGLSGSYLLTILGAYPVVIGAIADFVQGLSVGQVSTDSLSVLISLSLGMLCGVLGFSRVIHYFLTRHHDASLAVLIGFMLGALKAVWPFWDYAVRVLPLKIHKGPQLIPLHAIWPGWYSSTLWLGILAAIGSAILVLALEKMVATET